MDFKFKIYFICFVSIILSNDEEIDAYKDMFNKTFDYVNEGYVDSIDYSHLILSGIKKT